MSQRKQRKNRGKVRENQEFEECICLRLYGFCPDCRTSHGLLPARRGLVNIPVTGVAVLLGLSPWRSSFNYTVCTIGILCGVVQKQLHQLCFSNTRHSKPLSEPQVRLITSTLAGRGQLDDPKVDTILAEFRSSGCMISERSLEPQAAKFSDSLLELHFAAYIRYHCDQRDEDHQAELCRQREEIVSNEGAVLASLGTAVDSAVEQQAAAASAGDARGCATEQKGEELSRALLPPLERAAAVAAVSHRRAARSTRHKLRRAVVFAKADGHYMIGPYKVVADAKSYYGLRPEGFIQMLLYTTVYKRRLGLVVSRKKGGKKASGKGDGDGDGNGDETAELTVLLRGSAASQFVAEQLLLPLDRLLFDLEHCPRAAMQAWYHPAALARRRRALLQFASSCEHANLGQELPGTALAALQLPCEAASTQFVGGASEMDDFVRGWHACVMNRFCYIESAGTADNRKVVPVDCDGGTLQSTFSQFRFTFSATRGESNCIRLAAVSLYARSGAEAPEDGTAATAAPNTAGDGPQAATGAGGAGCSTGGRQKQVVPNAWCEGAGGISTLTDATSARTRWLDFLPSEAGARSQLILTTTSPLQLGSYTFLTANDASESDPISWTLHGRKATGVEGDDMPWVPMGEVQSCQAPTKRHRLYPRFYLRERVDY